MKANIHPKYHPGASIKCACGTSFASGSTVEETEIELCSNCHPFYTGKQKIVDSARRVEKFQLRSKKVVDSDTLAKKKEKAAKRNASTKDEDEK